MALAKDVMQGGFSAGQAKAINGSVASTVTAAGTVIGDAFDLVASINTITTAAASTGVQLPSCEIGDSVEILNLGANAVKVYPDSVSATINQVASFSLAPNTACKCRKFTSTKWMAFLSA